MSHLLQRHAQPPRCEAVTLPLLASLVLQDFLHFNCVRAPALRHLAARGDASLLLHYASQGHLSPRGLETLSLTSAFTMLHSDPTATLQLYDFVQSLTQLSRLKLELAEHTRYYPPLFAFLERVPSLVSLALTSWPGKRNFTTALAQQTKLCKLHYVYLSPELMCAIGSRLLSLTLFIPGVDMDMVREQAPGLAEHVTNLRKLSVAGAALQLLLRAEWRLPRLTKLIVRTDEWHLLMDNVIPIAARYPTLRSLYIWRSTSANMLHLTDKLAALAEYCAKSRPELSVYLVAMPELSSEVAHLSHQYAWLTMMCVDNSK